MSCLLTKMGGFRILPSVLSKINGYRMVAMARYTVVTYSELATSRHVAAGPVCVDVAQVLR